MKILTALLTITLSLALCLPVLGADYKTYNKEDDSEESILLTVDRDEWIFTISEDGEKRSYTNETAQVNKSGTTVYCGDNIVIEEDAIEFPEFTLLFKDVKRIRASQGKSSAQVVLSFIAHDSTRKESSFKRRMSDVVSCGTVETIAPKDFIRGSVIAFAGNVIVNGEVNGDVIALMGDIEVTENAVVRGDAIAVNGKVRLHKDASVYGLVKSGKGKQSSRRARAKRWKHHSNTINFAGMPNYNRVDGLLINCGLSYEHRDSLLPSFHLIGGYAFESERWRYDVGLSQTLVRGSVPIEIGGNVFRALKSDDDRIISDCENSIFTALVNEDWKDYYEAEGAYGFLRISPLVWNTVEIGYLAEKYNWLDSHPKLWSLIGSKDFRGNFSSVPHTTLTSLKTDLMDKKLTSFQARYTLDTRDDPDRPRKGWHGFATYEFSPERWNGDFDFTRVEGRVRRLHRLNRYQSVHLTGAYGYVRGDYIPLNRYFFMGGLGSIHGYRHKEFMGREYLLASIEYQFRFPHTGAAPFIQYDGGKISSSRLGSGDTWLSSISVGIDIERNFRLFISQRLDRDGEDPVIYARFSVDLAS